MVGVYSTRVAMKIRPPLHTCLVNGHELTIGNMVARLSGGELLTVERHRAPSLR